MFQKARETAYLESTSLLILIFRWKKPLGIMVLLALIASTIFSGSWFIAPKYKSTVIFFPTSTNSLSKAILEETGSEKQDILAYGEEEQAEQMLQILKELQLISVYKQFLTIFQFFQKPRNYHSVGAKVIGNLLV